MAGFPESAFWTTLAEPLTMVHHLDVGLGNLVSLGDSVDGN